MNRPTIRSRRAPRPPLLGSALLLVLGLGACATPLFPPPEPVPTPAPSPAPSVPDTRPKLAVPDPLELIFSAVQDTTSPSQPVTLHNTGNAPLVISELSLSGTDQDAFRFRVPPLPLTVAPGDVYELGVVFAPDAPGTAQAGLEIVSSDVDNARVTVGLYGLGSLGEQGENEPTLQEIAHTLGYGIAVGSSELRLGTGAEAVGDEVMVPLFERAGPGPVTLSVVARYGPETVFPYGFFTLGGATDVEGRPLERPLRREVGQIVASEVQMLLPQHDGPSGFDPGGEVFGIYGQAGEGTQYSLDSLNSGLGHALRVYPLRDRQGNPVPNSYLLGLEEAQNGDYQDAVFVIGNVRGAGE